MRSFTSAAAQSANRPNRYVGLCVVCVSVATDCVSYPFMSLNLPSPASSTTALNVSQTHFYPSFGCRPDVFIPILELAGKSVKKWFSAHGTCYALTQDGYLFATVC